MFRFSKQMCSHSTYSCRYTHVLHVVEFHWASHTLSLLHSTVITTITTFFLLSNVFVVFYFHFTITFNVGCILQVLFFRVHTILNT